MIKKIASISLFATLLLLSGCGGDNAYTGSGVIGGGTSGNQSDAFVSLNKNVFIQDSEALTASVSTLQTKVESFDQNLTEEDVAAMQNTFKSIMEKWKSVESAYVAADYDDSMIDIPQLFDFFHTGKKLDIPADLDNALASGTDMEDALFKYSSKGINALEYLLFGHTQSIAELTLLMNIDNRRRVEALAVVGKNLNELTTKISDFYNTDTKFTANEEDASNSIVNVLIDSSFKLKEWRIGEPTGIALKYKDNPDPERLEYVKSILTTEAIRAILLTHQRIMGQQSYDNFGSFASENGAASVVTQIQTKLNDAISIVNGFEKPMEELITTTSYDARLGTLYNIVKELQELYFTSLIQALDLTAEIIEADGD